MTRLERGVMEIFEYVTIKEEQGGSFKQIHT